ncbi:MAG: hypothetical protein KH244_11600 [Ruminococcus sp.]|nr:hypothetical protein [Ruminococcus sp.]
MQNMPTATELAIKYAKREQLRIIIDKALNIHENVVGNPSKYTDYIFTHKLGYPPLCKSEYNTNFIKCQV